MKRESFFEIEKEKLVKRSMQSANGECTLWTGPRSSDSLYGLVSFQHPDSRVTTKRKAHRFAVMVEMKDLDLDRELNCSHLCHNRLCINTRHISLEFNHINNNRKHCIYVGRCSGHEGFPDCMLHLILQ